MFDTKDFALVIPYRSDRGCRDRSFDWLQSRWNALLPGLRISTGDTPGEFSRSAARNACVRGLTEPFLIIADADSFVETDNLYEAMRLVSEGEAEWVLPYDVYLNLTAETSHQVLQLAPTSNLESSSLEWDHWIPGPHSPPAVSGVIVLKRSAVEAVNGWSERFKGWGYEDNAFAQALLTIVGSPRRIPGFCYHLWHPAPEETRFESPTIGVNRRLFERYKRANTPAAMKKLVEGSPGLR